VTRVLDHDVRLVASGGELGRNAREEIVEHAHHPGCARARALGGPVALPLRELGGRDAKNLRGRHRFIAGTKWAGRLRLGDLVGAKRGRRRVKLVAPSQGEGETLPAHVDDVGDDAGHRIFDPDQCAVAHFIFDRHPSILSLGAAGFSTRLIAGTAETRGNIRASGPWLDSAGGLRYPF